MFKWQETPLVRAVAFLILGILLADNIEPSSYYTAFLMILIVALAALTFFRIPYRYRWSAGILAAISMFLAGVTAVHLHDETYHKNHIGTFITPKKASNIVGIVSELPDKGNNIKIIVDVQSIDDTLAQGHVLLYLKPDDISNNIHYGDVLNFKGFVNLIRISKNPETFDFQRFMKYKNIRYLSYIKSEDVQKIAERRGEKLWHFAYDSQSTLIGVLSEYLTNNEEFSVASALILGFRSDIPDEVVQAYVNTGALHVLSVSGLHVGLVSIVIAFFLKKIKTRKKYWNWLDPLLQILFIWAFSLLTGAAPCVLRAAVMFSFLIVAKAYSQEVNIYNVLGSSTLVLLLWNPYFLYDVGFQLSYIGLAGILYFQPKIYEKGNKYIGKVEWLYNFYTFRFNDFKPKNKWILAVIKFPVAKYFWELTSVSLAATIAVTPLSLFYFHQFPTWFVLSGMIVVPISALALYVGIALFIVHPISSFLAKIIGKLLFGTIWLLNNSLFLIDKIPPGAIKHLWISGVTMLLIYLLVVFWIKKINSKEFKWLFYGGSLALILTSIHHNTAEVNHLAQKEITIYNTGYYTLIDCIEGKNSYAISSDDIPPRTVNFAAYNYRLSKNIKPDDVKVVAIQDSIQTETFSYQNACLEFGGKTLMLLSDTPIDSSIKLYTDYLFIRDNPKIDIAKLKEKVVFKELIFDASNKRYKVEKWKNYCDANKVPYHDITENYLTIKIR